MVRGWTAPIASGEAKDHIGEDASVRGLVEKVSFSKKGHVLRRHNSRYHSDRGIRQPDEAPAIFWLLLDTNTSV